MLIICLSTKNKLLDRHLPWKFLRFCQKLQVSEIVPQFWHLILLLKNCTNLIKHRTFLWEIQTILKKVSTFYRDHENEKRWLWFFFLLSDFWNIVEHQNEISLGTLWNLIFFHFCLQLCLYWDYLNASWIGWVNLQYWRTGYIFSAGNLQYSSY